MRIVRAWSEADLKKLAAIIALGGTALRAAAALKRSSTSCKTQARRMGTPFTPVWKARKAIRERCALAEEAMQQR
jgi:hypothetical protein